MLDNLIPDTEFFDPHLGFRSAAGYGHIQDSNFFLFEIFSVLFAKAKS